MFILIVISLPTGVNAVRRPERRPVHGIPTAISASMSWMKAFIRAMAEPEAEARQKAEAEQARRRAEAEKQGHTYRPRRDRRQAKPSSKAQRNFTDPGSPS